MLRHSHLGKGTVSSLRKFYYYRSSQCLSTIAKQEPSLEAELSFAQTNQFIYVSKTFHPCIVRALKNSRSLRRISPAYASLLQSASVILNDIDKNLRRTNNVKPEIVLGKLPRSELIRGSFGSSFYNMIKSSPSDAELMGFVALLHIFQAQNHFLWTDVDEYIFKRITYREGYNMELALLTAFAIKEYGRNFNFPTNNMSKTAVKVLHDLVLMKAQSQTATQQNPQEASMKITNQFEFYLSSVKDQIFHGIGTKDLAESKVLEYFSLQMHLMKYAEKPFIQKAVYDMLTKNYPNQENIPSISVVTQDLLPRGVQVFNSIQNPLKLKSLKSVWEIAVKLNFLIPSLAFYKKIYQQTLFSISMSPNQILNNEEVITSLFESMAVSKFASSSLINQICDVLLTQGFNLKRYGIPFFNLGLQIGAIDFSMKVMEDLLNSNFGDVSDLFLPQSKQNNGFHLFPASKTHLYQYLSDKYLPKELAKEQIEMIKKDAQEEKVEESSSSSSVDSRKYLNDLVISLLSFHRDDHRFPHYYRLFQRVEEEFLEKHIDALSSHAALSLLKCYCYAGRAHPQMISKLYEKIALELKEFNFEQLSFILYSFGRFPYLSLSSSWSSLFFQNTLELYREKLLVLRNAKQVAPNGSASFFRVFWSLAIIDQLDFDLFNEFEAYFYWMYRQTPVSSQLQTFSMMMQIGNHLSIRFREELRIAQGIIEEEENRLLNASDKEREDDIFDADLDAMNERNRQRILAALREDDPDFQEGEDDDEFEILSIEEKDDSDDESEDELEDRIISNAEKDKKTQKNEDIPGNDVNKKRHTLESLQNERNGDALPELMRGRFSKSSSSSSSSSSSLSSSYLGLTPEEFKKLPSNLQHQAIVLEKLQDFIDTSIKKQDFFKRLRQNAFMKVAPSYSQQVLSKGLAAHKIDHDSEKFIPDLHCFVDLYIPHHPQLPWSKVVEKDIILEFDGPFHFESFGRKPMGNTLLKQRQLRSLEDFHFISIPFWKFSTKMSHEETLQLITRTIVATCKNKAKKGAKESDESQESHAED